MCNSYSDSITKTKKGKKVMIICQIPYHPTNINVLYSPVMMENKSTPILLDSRVYSNFNTDWP